MKTMYRVQKGFGRVEAKEVLRETEKMVLFSEALGDREFKETSWHKYFSDEHAARDFAGTVIRAAIQMETARHEERLKHLHFQFSLISR